MSDVVISGSGLWTPEHIITNQELVESYNAWADQFNAANQQAIEQGDIAAKPHSSAEFIEKASGIRQRHVYIKDGILEPSRMRPRIPERSEDMISDQAQMAVNAAKLALKAANKSAEDIDAVIVSCAITQRSFPAISIEVQQELGIKGFGFDMLVACSAATFGLHRAYEMVKAGTAKAVLVINPELTSPLVNYTDRDSHFIFGDVATAAVVEGKDDCHSDSWFEIISTKAETVFSNNIRANIGYVNHANDSDPTAADKLFYQHGRKVFKEVCPMAAEHISSHLAQHNIEIPGVTRWWLHQANINMNLLIVKKLLGRDASAEEAPIVLDTYANTASAGSLIAFHLHQDNLQVGDIGVLCSFGAGYSIGSLLLRKASV
ncbi:beta-ketoacyl-ACP synthase III [Neptunicella marina]|uniref:Beta-ketoacyl-ACP synthase III n=1 Tax=Neptunicella marina TaxID=2125989 RepID=A0A8J6IR20_9ALTE|nr:beta-ketoacyl-ACP synthase III [Neptunicella marina]MBC3764789.1 beta-ketoacyl-ACP synthase III [Neptunicella marina]